MQEKLARVIDKERGTNLESCYENLNSIPPGSIEAERVFSECGICYKN
jgi:hypothetical protein